MEITFTKSVCKAHRVSLRICPLHAIEIYVTLDATRIIPFHIVTGDTPLQIVSGPIRVSATT